MSEIQITKILDRELKKDYQILVPYSLIESRIDQAIDNIQKNYKMDGFRKGQVPKNIIKRKYELSMIGEEAEKIINETSRKITDENNFRLAIAPKVEVKVLEPKKDFEYIVSIEILPIVPEIDLTNITVIKRNVEADKENIDEFVRKIPESHRKFDKTAIDYEAKNGDIVYIDYLGKIDGKAFEGGDAKNYELELGSHSFIAGFEEQLIGKKSGDDVVVRVKFPEKYHDNNVAGKDAEFEVKINSILSVTLPELNEEFLKEKYGFDNISQLEEMAKKQIEEVFEESARFLFKKELFDFLNNKYEFAVPESLVNDQFKNIWQEIEVKNKFVNDEDKEKAKQENLKLATRMIRSGIILSDLATKNNLTVSDDEMIADINKKISRFPHQADLFVRYYKENPDALRKVRGTILEDKVIDFIITQAGIKIAKISVKDFQNLES